MSSSFYEVVSRCLTYARENPEAMEKTPDDMLRKLKEYMKSNGQGSANKVTPHEASFAVILEEFGFVLCDRKTIPTSQGYYYIYQLGGSQTKGDFVLLSVDGGNTLRKLVVDLKHTESKTFYLNDGWFESDTLYVVSFNAGTKKYPKPTCMIGMGADIPTKAENMAMADLIRFKKKTNEETPNVDSLRTYIRFANQYGCKRFTPEFNSDLFQKMLTWLSPSDSQTLPEPHSPPA
jgi:hypothetical protein